MLEWTAEYLQRVSQSAEPMQNVYKSPPECIIILYIPRESILVR